jgi:thymidylate synthase ThyX
MSNRQVYLLSPRELSPETIAVTFAKTSRSPGSFREIAAELNEESSAKFHERWVVGYGHASVAEHAILHIAIENVSRLAVECIESNRLASYTEKSTRYQKWAVDNYFIPPELDNHPLRETFIRTCKLLFDAYAQSLVPMRRMVENQNPRRENELEEAYDRRIRSQYVDSCRFLLPAASLANLGMTANARVLEHAISKMLSHPLAEVREIGDEIKLVAKTETPTLVKYAEAAPYLIGTREDFFLRAHGSYHEKNIITSENCAPRDGDSCKSNFGMNNIGLSMNLSFPQETGHSELNIHDWCQLMDFDPDGEIKILAAALYRFGEMSYFQALEIVRSASESDRVILAETLLCGLGEHDTPLRELEYTTYTFDLILDQGGYAEFKRHRIMTQTPQMLSSRLGYVLPRQIVTSGFEQQYRSAMDAAAEAYELLADWNLNVASYVVPNGYNRRLLFTLNLREAFAFCKLRSAANAHFSMRRVAQGVASEIRRVHPLLAKYMHLPEETWQDIETQNL